MRDLALIGVVIVAATAARLFMLYLVLPLLTALKLSPRVDRPYRVAILWGGLRGAVTLALALAVTENLRVLVSIKREVGILATGFTLYTLLMQGTTLRWIISPRAPPMSKRQARRANWAAATCSGSSRF